MRAKEREWQNGHKSLHITEESYIELVKWAGRVQSRSGTITSISDALIFLIEWANAHSDSLDDGEEVVVTN